MRRMTFNTIEDLAQRMIDESRKDDGLVVSAICFYEYGTALISEILKSDIGVENIEIAEQCMDGYDKEYLICIYDDLLNVEPLYKENYENGYAYHEDDITYIHQDCNSRILKFVYSDAIIEFKIDEIDDDNEDCFGETTNCKCKCYGKDESIRETTEHSLGESTQLHFNSDGALTGFTKTWDKSVNGIDSYSTYTIYSNDPDEVKRYVDYLGIDFNK